MRLLNPLCVGLLLLGTTVLVTAQDSTAPAKPAEGKTSDAEKDTAEAAEVDPGVQWDALYKPGNWWTTAFPSSDMLMKTEVVSVADGVAKVKTSVKLGDADWMEPSESEAWRPEKPDNDAEPDPKWTETGSGVKKVKVGEIELECQWVEGEYDGKKVATVISTLYGVIVKSEYDGAVSMELVELHLAEDRSTTAEPTDKPDAEAADPYDLYKTKGRSWTHKSTSKMGETEIISFIKYEITEVTDTDATQKTSLFDKDMKPNEWVKPRETRIPFNPPVDDPEAPEVETTEETIEMAGKSWDCTVMETEHSGLTTRTWISKEFPGLMVKSVTDGETSGMKMHIVTELTEWVAG